MILSLFFSIQNSNQMRTSLIPRMLINLLKSIQLTFSGRTDQFVLSWLLSSISEQMLGHVLHCKSASEVWIVLEQTFSAKSKARAL